MEGARDSQVDINVSDANYRFRYGGNADIPPRCPLGYCADD